MRFKKSVGAAAVRAAALIFAVIFAAGCGAVTMVIRLFGGYPEGVSFSILLMNIITPYIDRFTMTKPFGAKKEVKQK